MRRALSLALILAVLLTMGAPAALAGSAPPAPGSRLAHLAPDIGDTVTISNLDGDEIGTVTLEDIIDPFDEFEERADPGLRFLSIELTIENTGEDELEIDTGNIGVVDEVGTIFVGVAVTRTDGADELEDTTLEPGDDITGSLAVGFPEDGEIAQIIWFVETGILPIIYNAAEPVAPGDTVMLSTADYENYEAEAELTVDELLDPLEDVETGNGFRAVGATISIENAGEEPFAPEPESFYLGTTDGIFWSPDPSIERTDDAIDELPDLTDDEIEPGDQATGFAGFLIPEDAEIAYLMYFPTGGTRMVRIFDAGVDEDVTPEADETPEDGDNGGNLGPIGRDDETPEADETPQDDDNGNAAAECEGAAEWVEETAANFGALQEAMSGNGMGVDFSTSSPSALRDAAEVTEAAAEAQANNTPPPAVEEVNELLVEFFTEVADILNEAADAEDQEALDDAQQRWTELGVRFQSDDVMAIFDEAATTCPELNELPI